MTGLPYSVTFTVPGEPRPKGRPRFARRGQFVHTYTDEQTANYENRIMMAASAAMGAAGFLAPMPGPVRVTVTARMKVPASASNKRQRSMLAGELLPTKRPDLDQFIKVCLDGMNGVVVRDDSQVTYLEAAKEYAETPSLEVTVIAL